MVKGWTCAVIESASVVMDTCLYGFLDRDLLYISVTYQKSSTIRRRDKSKDDAILAVSCYALCFGKA